MDLLKGLISKKRKAQSDLKKKAEAQGKVFGKKKKYIRRGDLEEILYSKSSEDIKRTQNIVGNDNKSSDDKLESGSSNAVSKSKKLDNENVEKQAILNKEEVVSRLRDMGQPVTLFGEDDMTRLRRLRKLEKSGAMVDDGFNLEAAHRVRNAFMDKEVGEGSVQIDEEDEDDDAVFPSSSSSSLGNKDKTKESTKELTDERYIYKFLKKMLKEWAQDLSKRSESERLTARGKIATKTHKQCKDYIRPFFKLLKKEKVPADVLSHVKKIVMLCEQREYVQAADWYIQITIGNAAWPIGVTMVGIHERSGRERIESSKVAHVMNDEMQRKYLTSIKRIMTYAQTKYPANPSKMISS